MTETGVNSRVAMKERWLIMKGVGWARGAIRAV